MKQLALLLTGWLCAMIVCAAPIDRNAALLKAQRLMPGKQFAAGHQARSARAKALLANEAFYIFNAADDGGFVIVSGDDRATEILGYAEHGNLDVDALPENLAWWLESYAREIGTLYNTPATTSEQVSRAPSAAIAPMTTAQWNQSSPYYNRCPDGSYVDYDEMGYNANERCLTGCVAVAMAQAMHYWQWPVACGAMDAYDANGHTIKALPATTFKWEQMKESYGKTETGAAADAVAELMRYCGQAVQMKYGTDNSSASLHESDLINTFQYSPNCYWLMRDGYTANRWVAAIHDELVAQRPVLYRGDSETSAHIFIIDGYDGNGLFHINWGWGGQHNGYFAISALNPGTHGTYQYNQYAMIGLQPAQQGEQPVPLMQCSVSESSDTYLHYRSESYDLEGTVVAHYNLAPASPLKAEIGWALYQGDTFVQVLSSKTVTFAAQQQSHCLNGPRISFASNLPSGTYLLCQIYRFEGDTEWQLCHPYQDNPYMLVLELTDTYFYTRPYNMLTDGITTIGYQAAENGGRNGAESVGNSAGTGSWYNLQGIQVPQPRKGLFIKDGRSILVP